MSQSKPVQGIVRRSPRSLAALVALVGLLVGACAGVLGSRSWVLPETADARRCYDECRESRRLCSNRTLRSDMMPERAPAPTSLSLPVDDAERHRYEQCESAFDGCVGGCPGAERR